MSKKIIPKESELSILQAELIDQYFRAQRGIEAYQKEIELLPRGYISNKIISGKAYSYLQWREGKKVHSRYIKKSELESVVIEIRKRRAREESIKRLEDSMKDIIKFMGRELIEYYAEK